MTIEQLFDQFLASYAGRYRIAHELNGSHFAEFYATRGLRTVVELDHPSGAAIAHCDLCKADASAAKANAWALARNLRPGDVTPVLALDEARNMLIIWGVLRLEGVDEAGFCNWLDFFRKEAEEAYTELTQRFSKDSPTLDARGPSTRYA